MLVLLLRTHLLAEQKAGVVVLLHGDDDFTDGGGAWGVEGGERGCWRSHYNAIRSLLFMGLGGRGWVEPARAAYTT